MLMSFRKFYLQFMCVLAIASHLFPAVFCSTIDKGIWQGIKLLCLHYKITPCMPKQVWDHMSGRLGMSACGQYAAC